MKSKVLYGDAINGMNEKYLQTCEQIIEQVRDNPVSTEPDEPFFFGTDGSSWSIQEIADMAGITLTGGN